MPAQLALVLVLALGGSHGIAAEAGQAAQGTASAVATTTGHAIQRGVRRGAAAVERGAKRAGEAIQRGATKTGAAAERAAKATGRAVDKGARKTTEGIRRGANKLGLPAAPASTPD